MTSLQLGLPGLDQPPLTDVVLADIIRAAEHERGIYRPGGSRHALLGLVLHLAHELQRARLNAMDAAPTGEACLPAAHRVCADDGVTMT
ncbi:hypothetical protein [Limobrevibacterium gyesilva]|uniref:Uncharacterized protein n=1 Tax=Limobrevibacterium gyesilva TaxID=2991712 RepID=A0AA41YS84_9PROT|nr:hypothetical protein [Limobrevibacterium gyesilva]MCW3477388.1 hypothetical protein [Limobrevibacterium gyesilva]